MELTPKLGNLKKKPKTKNTVDSILIQLATEVITTKIFSFENLSGNDLI